MATQQDSARALEQVVERLASFEPVTATVAVNEGTVPEVVAEASPAPEATRPQGAELADTLVRLAQQTDAAVKMIEDPALLESVGGVAAALRFRLDRSNANAEQQGEKP